MNFSFYSLPSSSTATSFKIYTKREREREKEIYAFMNFFIIIISSSSSRVFLLCFIASFTFFSLFLFSFLFDIFFFRENARVSLLLLIYSMANNSFKFFYDLHSPLSRALVILFEGNKVQCQKIHVALRKGSINKR